jgi:hypothetical protein
MMLLSARRSTGTSQRGKQPGLLFVLLLIGHLSIMTFPSQAMGQEMLSQDGSGLATVASDEQVSPPPMRCPVGPSDCMLAWSQAPASTASVGSISHLAIGSVAPLLAVGPSPVPSSYSLSPPHRANLQALLQVFRL